MRNSLAGKRTTADPGEDIPVAPGGLPVVGHAVKALRDPRGFLRSLPAHGDVMSISVGPLKAVMVCDPELTSQILLNDRTYDKGGLLFDRAKEVFGDGLVTCPHSMHRRERRLVQPAFHRNRLSGYAQVMTEGTSLMIGKWRHGQVLDMPAEMLSLTMHNMLQAMLGGTLPPQDLRQLVSDAIEVQHATYRQTFTPAVLNRIPTPGNRRYQRALAGLHNTVTDIIAKAQANPEDHGDLLSALLASRDTGASECPVGGAQSERLSSAELRNEVLTFLVAGSETTAIALSWALYMIARHPDVQQRLWAEVDRVLEGKPVSLDHLPDLKLADQIITETLRLYPPAGMIWTRIVTADTRLGDYDIPAGTTIAYSPYAMHRLPHYYPNPDAFDPDRWDAEKRHSTPRNNAFLTFGGGARKCIGDQFAVTEAVLALADIASRWRLEPMPGQGHPAITPSMGPRDLKMRLTARAAA
ncbi:cytochrome P450 [Kitasatospora sp. NBC_00240]|uniref:cytochrome P450 n=1 Tax=Kitasatospora sp. NBC_00240 TaxID=2903567 RepID=UPI0022533699|nr:cytochrome P450 [Kitasatospora sp. NBC_00240]MCX5213308.1 cytochrome P450 [Kitasatospora sp. NBC_00240]